MFCFSKGGLGAKVPGNNKMNFAVELEMSSAT